MNDPEISVVIPTHNRRRELETCLQSVLAQEAVSLEVIVVDDGSTDGTASLLETFGDAPLRVVRHDHARGQAPSRNAGAREVRGDWIAFIDDDDLWAPEKLGAQLQAARATGADFVYTGAVRFRTGHVMVENDKDAPAPGEVASLLARFNPLPGGCSAQFVSRALFESLGGFDENFNNLCDWDLWLRVSSRCTLAAVRLPLVGYRIHPGNRIATYGHGHKEEFHRLVRKHRSISKEQDEEFDGVGFYYWIANGQIRAGNHLTATLLHLEAARRYRSLKHLGSALRAPLGPRALGWRQSSPKMIPTPAWLRELLDAEQDRP